MKKRHSLFGTLLAAAVLFSAGGFVSVVEADAATTRYEAEDATITGANIKPFEGQEYGNGTASGTWVGDMGASSTVEFSVNVAEDGEYNLTLSYASGSTTQASLLVYNAEGYFVEVQCPNTAGWGAFQTVSSTISLRAGTSTVTVKKGEQIAELDYIEIGDRVGDYKEGNTETVDPNDIKQPTEGYTRYEAEAGTVNNCQKESNYGPFSGTGFVAGIDHDDSYVAFTVNVGADGEYALNVAYATEFEGATLKVHNADGFYTEVSCSTIAIWGSFTKSAIASATISLRSGESVVTVYKGNSHAQVDFIEIGARVGDYTSGEEEQVDPNDIKQPTEGYTRYESENGTHNATLYTEGTFSGTGYVGDLDNDNQYVEYKVTVAEAGEYALNVAYATGAQGATLKVHNGDGFYAELACSNIIAWGQFSKLSIATGTISLNAGENTVRVYKGNSFAQVDFIEIGAKTGEYVEKAWTTVRKQIAAISTDEITATNYETVKAAVVAAETAYGNLTESEKALVDNYATLTARRAAITAYEQAEAQKQANATAVVNQIAALSTDEITATNYADVKTAVEAAETAYGNLTDEEKELVNNYATLTARREAITAYEQAEAQKQANATAVVNQIAALSTDEITAQNYETVKAAVEAAETAYGNLTESEKALVDNYAILTARREAITAYEASLLPPSGDSSDSSSDSSDSSSDSSDSSSDSSDSSSDSSSSGGFDWDDNSSDTESDTESETGSSGDNENKSGCWASVSGAGILAGLAVVAGARLISKKKED